MACMMFGVSLSLRLEISNGIRAGCRRTPGRPVRTVFWLLPGWATCLFTWALEEFDCETVPGDDLVASCPGGRLLQHHDLWLAKGNGRRLSVSE